MTEPSICFRCGRPWQPVPGRRPLFLCEVCDEPPSAAQVPGVLLDWIVTFVGSRMPNFVVAELLGRVAEALETARREEREACAKEIESQEYASDLNASGMLWGGSEA